VSTAARLATEAKAIFEAADKQGRALTGEERLHVQDLVARAEEHADCEKSFREIDRKLGGGVNNVFAGGGQPSGASPGEMFTMSEGYRSIKSAGSRGQSWTSGLVDVGYSMKGTLLEGAGSPGSGSGGGLVPVPQVVPGVVGKLFAPLVLENLLLSGQATGNTVRFAQQGTATSGAAGVAEGGNKPESTIGYGTTDEAVKKIATSITISDELLEDGPAVQQLINGQLSLFVRIECERQLIRGAAGGNEVQGLLTSRSVPVYAGGTAAGNKAVQLFKAMSGMRGSAFVEPEWIAIHPTDWQDIRLLTDTAGQFFGGGPFQGPYGSGANYSASGQLTGAVDYLWNKPVYLTPALGAGTALIGNSESAQVWNRGGLRIESTNSHASNFTSDLSVVRAERRLALAVYRSNGFVEARIS
jgi:HK97 family phage major capsid protein